MHTRDKPLQSKKAMKAHRNGPKSCIRARSGARNSSLEESVAEGYIFFTEPPALPASQSGGRAAARGRSIGGRASRGGGRARGGGGGRGRKSAATKAREEAALAAFLAKKYPGTSKLAATVAAAASGGGGNSSAADAADVQFVGERTREERDAELREAAIDVED